MFTQRLNELMKLLKLSPSELASLIGCDRSNISRVCSGTRVPKPMGKTSRKITSALISAAKSRGLSDIISRRIGSAELNEADLLEWLYGNSQTISLPNEAESKTPYTQFAQKLSSLMELGRLSNVRFARLLNIDASYISRFRNGQRCPKSNSKLMNSMGAVLWERINEQNNLDRLPLLTEKSIEELSAPVSGQAAIIDWLFGAGRYRAISNAADFVNDFDKSFSADAPQFASTAPVVSGESKKLYFGSDGLREAAAAFLSEVIVSGAGEIYLYSDENMDWISSDKAFLDKWRSLMASCVQNGTSITIVHNIDRQRDEMTRAIKSWLPLYHSGKINSYYCTSERGSRFSTVMFLCPGLCCVSGHNPIGFERTRSMYRLSGNKQALEHFRYAFEDLLSLSVPLIRTLQTYEAEVGKYRNTSGLTVLSSRLSLATMPKAVLFSLLKRSGADEAAVQLVTAIWENRRRQLVSDIIEGVLREYIPICGRESFEKEPPFADIPIPVRYNFDEYEAHCANIRSLTNKYRNYRFIALKEPPFENIRVRISGEYTAVSSLNEPFVTLISEHPLICGAFMQCIPALT